MPTKLYVGNLPLNFPEASLRNVFSHYSGLDKVAVMKNFGFVHFTDENEASKAIKDLDGSTIGDKKVSVEISKSQGEKGGDRDRGRERGGRDGGRDRDRGDRDRSSRRERDRNSNRGPPGGNGAGVGPGLGPLIGGLGGLGALGAPAAGQLGGALGGLGGGQLGGLGGGQLGGLSGGQLGGLGGGELGNILSAVNALAAVAEKTQQMNSIQSQQQQQVGGLQQQQQQQQQPQQAYHGQPDAVGRGHREVAPSANVPNATSGGASNGYVIYERYYVDPTHALLKGLPLPQLLPQTDLRRDVLPDLQQRNDNIYRDRSPVNGNRDQPTFHYGR